MSTYNGEEFLDEQLKSLDDQEFKEFQIIIRDDGSNDSTTDIVKKWQKKRDNIIFYTGENKKTAKSFIDLLVNSGEADYFAFCDQDDYWEKEKMKKAIEQLSEFDYKPSLYYSEVKVVDEKLNFLYKTNYTGIDSVGSSYSTTPVIGCTMVINNKLKDIIVSHLPEKISMHDSWIYRSCLAVGGKVIHDKDAYILYRQHGNNVMGISNSIFDKVKSYKNYLGIRTWTAENILKAYDDMIAKKDKEIICKIAQYDKKMNLMKKLSYITDKNYKSNKKNSDLRFKLDVLLGKI